LKVKQKEYEKAEDSEDIERLVTETEILRFVLFLVCRNESKKLIDLSSDIQTGLNYDHILKYKGECHMTDPDDPVSDRSTGRRLDVAKKIQDYRIARENNKKSSSQKTKIRERQSGQLHLAGRKSWRASFP
jgi:hypothetical protein